MTAAVWKKAEELTINLKCTIGVLMTDWGKYSVVKGRGETGIASQPYFIQ